MDDLSKLSFKHAECAGNALVDLDIVIADEQQKIGLLEQLALEFESIYLDGKRSLVAQSYQIPTWIYFLIIVLGWNEFVSILKSPLYLLLAILTASLFGITHVLGIQDVLISKSRAYFDNVLKQVFDFFPSSSINANLQSSKEKSL